MCNEKHHVFNIDLQIMTYISFECVIYVEFDFLFRINLLKFVSYINHKRTLKPSTI